MTRFTICKRKFLKKLAEHKKQIPDNIKKQAVIDLIRDFKIATHKINGKHPHNLIKLFTLIRVFINQYMLIQSQPVPKFPKGGIISKGGIAEPIL